MTLEEMFILWIIYMATCAWVASITFDQYTFEEDKKENKKMAAAYVSGCMFMGALLLPFTWGAVALFWKEVVLRFLL